MPELPEVETVRGGLDRWITGRVVASAEVRHPRSIRRHLAGPDDLVARLVGRRVIAISRRGKYLWLPLGDADATAGHGATGECLVGHLGMSGQLLVEPSDAPDEKHLHVRVRFADDGPELRFVDQRTFGGVLVDRLVPTTDRPADEPSAELIPASIGHIARDPLDPVFDDGAFIARLRRRDTELKRALLDQTLVSGIGNIYADESLWRARLHGRRRTATLTRTAVGAVLASVREVLGEAIRAGGTSFDALYVNVNGASGYFDRSLAVYGQQDRPCPRCGAAVRREQFMNRSSFSCPVCQPAPRARTAGAADTPGRSG